MKPKLNSDGGFGRRLAWTLLAAAPLFAQRPADGPPSIDVSAPRNYVLAARALQFSARVVNARGAYLRGAALQWSVSPSARANIDSSGLLSALSPGAVDVTASDASSGISGTFRVYVYPASIAVDPAVVSVETGATARLSARALDADGKEIAGVPLRWSTDRPEIAKVAPDGSVTGVAEGRVTVSAAIDMGTLFAGFTGLTSINVLRRADFRLRTLISTDTVSKTVSTLAVTRFTAAGPAAAVIASLSNGGQAVLLLQNGRIQTIASTGVSLNGRPVTRFEGVNVNAAGDVVVVADAQSEWCEQLLVVFPASTKWAPVVLDDTTRCSYWGSPPPAIDANRGVVYRYSNAVYYRKPDGSVQALVKTGDSIAGVSAISWMSDWSVTPSGKVILAVNDASGVTSYVIWDGSKFQKIFTNGDVIGSRTTQWSRTPIEIAPDTYISRIGGSNWSSISRYSDGKWSTVVVNNQSDSLWWVQDYYAAFNGTIYFVADTPGGTSLWKTSGSTPVKVATYGSWREITGLATTPDGLLAYGTLGKATPRVDRFTENGSATLIGPDIRLDVPAGLAFGQASIPKGVNPSSLILRSFGDSLLRANGSSIAAVLQPGDPLGAAGPLASIGAFAGNRLGDVVFTALHSGKWGLFSYRGGQVQTLADSDDHLPDTSSIWGFTGSDQQVAMNNAGHAVALTYGSAYNGFLLYAPGALPREIVRQGNNTPSSAIYSGLAQVAIDEGDRIAFVANLSNGKAGVFLWDRGKIQQLLETGQKDPAGRTLQSFYNLQAAGNKFYLRAYAGNQEYLVLNGTDVRIALDENYVASFGTLLANGIGPELTANSRGDIAIPVNTPSGPAMIVKRADGSDALVGVSSRRGPDGEWFMDFYGAGLSEQGELVFSALGWIDGHQRMALYYATPNVP